MIQKLARLAYKHYELSAELLALAAAVGLFIGKQHVAAYWLLSAASLAACIRLGAEAWQNLRSGRYGVDVLAITSVVTAIILKQYWVAMVVVVLLTVDTVLTNWAARRARSELSDFLERAPSQAHVLRGRRVIDLPADKIHKGDKLLVKTDETVPVDAVVLEGKASLDESLLTGESLPQNPVVGENVLAGSIIVDGEIKIRALHSASDSQYSQTARFMRAASASQARFTRTAEQYVIPFMVTVYAMAAVAWIVSGHAIRFLDVIVVASPASLLFAAPIAINSGISLASRYGIIFKSGSAFEKLAAMQTLTLEEVEALDHSDSKAILGRLKKLGVEKLILLTGSPKVRAQKIAKRLGIADVRADAQPGDKLHAIDQMADHPVVFMGDGAADAAALTAADVGIALAARGTATASESADVVIMLGDLNFVVTALAITRRSLRIAKQSILLGLGLSVVLAVLFASGQFPPLAGVLIQAVVVALVIFYALRAHAAPKLS